MYYGLGEFDRRIAEHLVESKGTFVELGAGDGLKHSNTLFFEERGWRGVLIERIPAQYERCILNRPLARVFNCACVPFGKEGVVEMISVGYMSMVVGAMGGGSRETEMDCERCTAPRETCARNGFGSGTDIDIK
jgi:hypothetical protein